MLIRSIDMVRMISPGGSDRKLKIDCKTLQMILQLQINITLKNKKQPQNYTKKLACLRKLKTKSIYQKTLHIPKVVVKAMQQFINH